MTDIELEIKLNTKGYNKTSISVNTLSEIDKNMFKFLFEHNIGDCFDYKGRPLYIVECPICGEKMFDDFSICFNCFWEYDGTVEGYSFANKSTVKEYKENFKNF